MKFSYGWVVVGIGALMTCIGMGAMMSLAVYLAPISETTGWSRERRVGHGDAEFPLHGHRRLRLGRSVGSVRHPHRRALCGASARHGPCRCEPGNFASGSFSSSTACWWGLAAGSFYAPMIAVASAWIDTHRSLAVALVSAGMGVAPLTVAQFASWLNINL